MASLMLLTSVSFIVDMHYCGNRLVSLNFFGKAKTCHEMVSTSPDCPRLQEMAAEHSGCSVMPKGCCSNKSFKYEADQDQSILSIGFELIQPIQQFIAAYVAVFYTPSILLQSDQPSFADYEPPLISRDYSVLFQSFLI